jgi:hypothetical protein
MRDWVRFLLAFAVYVGLAVALGLLAAQIVR